MKFIELYPLTRVEGHGGVRVYLDGLRVEKVELRLTESPRLFEALLLGKRFEELPEIICRICSLCSTVHRITSLSAIEQAFEIEVPPHVRLYRELIKNGGHLASHALHLFCLVLPDHLGLDGFPELAREAPESLKLGMRLKAAGNLIQEMIGGRLIHPVTLIVGGMGKPPGRAGLKAIREALEPLLPDALRACELFGSFSPEGNTLPAPRHLALAPEEHGGNPRLITSGGRCTDVGCYRDLLNEQIVAYGNAKRSAVAGGPVTTSALARLNLGMPLLPKAAGMFDSVSNRIVGADMRANNLAQAVEMVHLLERSLEIVNQLLEEDLPPPPTVPFMPRGATGTAAMEAPRGTLIHSYSFDSRGICTAADIITPTAINQSAMETDLLAAAKAHEGDTAGMKRGLEMLVRAYDPCISCAVHILQIP